jgi:hypothetical protein
MSIQFFIYLDTLKVGKLEELTCKDHFNSRFSLDIWGLQSSRSNLRYQKTHFVIKKFLP